MYILQFLQSRYFYLYENPRKQRPFSRSEKRTIVRISKKCTHVDCDISRGICILARCFIIKIISKIFPECIKEYFEGLIDRKSRFRFESSCSSHTNTLRIILTQCVEFRYPYSMQARHSGDTNSYYQSNIVQNTTCCIKVKFQNFRKTLSSVRLYLNYADNICWFPHPMDLDQVVLDLEEASKVELHEHHQNQDY